jgi:phosphoglycolate phosphatase
MKSNPMNADNNGNSDGRFANVRVAIFDLDGTLIDSKVDLALSVNATLRHMGRGTLADATIFGYIGNGAASLVRQSLGGKVTDEEAEKGLAYFLSYYREHMLDNTIAYPGVRETLESLNGLSLAVLTNKPVRFSRAILEGLGLAHFFRYVYGGNSFETKKPDPLGVNILLRDFEVQPREAIIVGDSDVDVRTARNAGTWACGVSYGFGLKGLRAHPPDLMIDNLEELPAHLVRKGVPRDA